jgi:ABC-type sugar transport system permease subunit
MRKRKNLFAYLMLLPGFLFFLFAYLLPILGTVYLSFFKWSGFGAMKFIGLENYVNRLINDRVFFIALKNTILFVILVVLIQIGLSLLLAVLLESNLKFAKFIRGVYFVPTVISFIVVGLLFNFVFSPSVGFVNVFLKTIGLGVFAGQWLADPGKALFIVILIYIWKSFGISLFLIIAGIQSIPMELFEAAMVDGANIWNKFFNITLPLLTRVVVLNMILAASSSLKVFDLVYSLTKGGPVNATEVLGTYMYAQGFSFLRFGYGAAISIVIFLIALVITLIQLNARQRVLDYLEGVN